MHNPKHPDKCQHGPSCYAGRVNNADLYFYRDTESRRWHYCSRHGDELPEYSSGEVWHLARMNSAEAARPGSTYLGGQRNEYEPGPAASGRILEAFFRWEAERTKGRGEPCEGRR